ncbi:hypothetical protein BESB_031390 [Besnoitia besnoiti]|uniref:Uncharacterized protein n=1 Tax=Besnoitia besnoiti TaxID=94643 RepID=A0A2A9LZU9_BESBE|nr:hypothetical protein BESB_031390 [Besnoitia besnoiti]PFH31265.1 hypothetical protein BESB_031390 [Besnoitia besnoiti]
MRSPGSMWIAFKILQPHLCFDFRSLSFYKDDERISPPGLRRTRLSSELAAHAAADFVPACSGGESACTRRLARRAALVLCLDRVTWANPHT